MSNGRPSGRRCSGATDLIANARVTNSRRLIDAHAVAAQFRRHCRVAIVLPFRAVQTEPVRRAHTLVTSRRVLAFRPVLTS